MTTDQYTSPEHTIADQTTSSDEANPLAEAGRDVGDSASHLAERATGLGMEQADRGREQAATGVESVAESIRRVSADLETEQPTIASAAQTAADQAERIARYLRETDARQIVTTIEDAARRQPLVFVGGAFVLGFIASRVIKAGGGFAAPSEQRDRSGNGAGGRKGVTSLTTGTRGYEATGPGTATRTQSADEGM